MINTHNSSHAPPGIGPEALFPDRGAAPAPLPAHPAGLFGGAAPAGSAFRSAPSPVVAIPVDYEQFGYDRFRPVQVQPGPVISERPVVPWYRTKRVWVAATLLLVAVGARLATEPQQTQLQSAVVQPDGDR